MVAPLNLWRCPATSGPEEEPALTVSVVALRLELLELAFTLDRQGRADAADLARAVSARLAELVTSKEASEQVELAGE